MSENTFEAIVRGYQGFGMSGCGAVVVEVAEGVEIPSAAGLREVGSVTRGDGLEIERAVHCIGDWRPCRHIAEELRDQSVIVGLDDMGLLPTFSLPHQEGGA